MGFTSNSPPEVDKILLEHLVSDDRDKLPSWLIPRHEELKWEARHAIANRLRYLRKIQERADHRSFITLCKEHDVTPRYCGIMDADAAAAAVADDRLPSGEDEVTDSAVGGGEGPGRAARRKKISLATTKSRGGQHKKMAEGIDTDDREDLDTLPRHDAEVLGLKKRKLEADARCKEAESKQKEFEMKLKELEYKKVLLAQYEALKAQPDEWPDTRIAKAFPEMTQFFR